MRTSFVVLLGMLAMARPAQAQGYPAEMVITSPEVEVRSGPTKEYYATTKIRQGDRVLVLHESEQQKGWLAIKPPPRSFSWINDKFVKQIDGRTAVVVKEGGAKIRTGSSLSNKPPDVEPPLTIPQGAIVTILDKGKTADGVTWLPIQPWHLEERFIPGEAVQTRQLANNNSANINGQLTSLQSSPWNPAQAPGYPNQTIQGSSWAVGQTASFTQTNTASQKLTYPPQWTELGVLRRVADKDGQPMYALEDVKSRKVLLYANCQPGTTLRDYVGRTIRLYGSVNYRSDDYVRTHVLTASHVAVY